MKICNRCKIKKEDQEFSPAKKKSWMGLASCCKECKRAYEQGYWLKNREKLLIKKAINKQKSLDRNLLFVVNFLKNHSCIDCGETDLIVLEFDHVRGTKKNSICEMVLNTVSIKTLKEEINKCDIRCANCHRRKTARERNYKILNFL